MPHVELKCFPGRTEEQKRRCVSVAIKDVDEEDWKEEVWDKDIAAHRDYLYKEPGYTY